MEVNVSQTLYRCFKALLSTVNHSELKMRHSCSDINQT